MPVDEKRIIIDLIEKTAGIREHMFGFIETQNKQNHTFRLVLFGENGRNGLVGNDGEKEHRIKHLESAAIRYLKKIELLEELRDDHEIRISNFEKRYKLLMKFLWPLYAVLLTAIAGLIVSRVHF